MTKSWLKVEQGKDFAGKMRQGDDDLVGNI
jgi:hypothetical protein